MLHSLAAQVSYYSSLIQNHKGWLYSGVYSDEAKTGTKDTREAFQRLISDCKVGKIDIVITKSISRFARNTVTLLQTIRELKAIGVDVYFEEQNIHTLSSEGELLITILASYAQEESRSVSENCKWRIRNNFKQGIAYGFRVYGYDVLDKQLVINEEQAAVVRKIFEMYVNGYGSKIITDTLNGMKIPAPEGDVWHQKRVLEILRNEKYVGDLLMQIFYSFLIKNDPRNTVKVDRGSNGFLTIVGCSATFSFRTVIQITRIRLVLLLFYRSGRRASRIPSERPQIFLLRD